MTQFVTESLIAYHGEDAVLESDIWMAAEDFAYYTKVYPSTFYIVGIANGVKRINSGLHTPTFQIDEYAFDQAIGGMLYTAIRLLNT